MHGFLQRLDVAAKPEAIIRTIGRGIVMELTYLLSYQAMRAAQTCPKTADPFLKPLHPGTRQDWSVLRKHRSAEKEATKAAKVRPPLRTGRLVLSVRRRRPRYR